MLGDSIYVLHPELSILEKEIRIKVARVWERESCLSGQHVSFIRPKTPGDISMNARDTLNCTPRMAKK